MEYSILLPRNWIDNHDFESMNLGCASLDNPIFDTTLKNELFGLQLIVGERRIGMITSHFEDFIDKEALYNEIKYQKYRGLTNRLVRIANDDTVNEKATLIHDLAILEIQFKALLIKCKYGYSNLEDLYTEVYSVLSSDKIGAMYIDFKDDDQLKGLVYSCQILDYSVESFFMVNCQV